MLSRASSVRVPKLSLSSKPGSPTAVGVVTPLDKGGRPSGQSSTLLSRQVGLYHTIQENVKREFGIDIEEISIVTTGADRPPASFARYLRKIAEQHYDLVTACQKAYSIISYFFIFTIHQDVFEEFINIWHNFF